MNDELEFFVFYEQRSFGSGVGNGCIFCVTCELNELKKDEKISYGLYFRSVCIFSVNDAYGGLYLRTYNCAAICSVSEMYPLDRINTIALYWRKHDMGISKRRRRN